MQPYTYHLYHKPTNRHYYGVSYRQGCSPDELWKSYFSSSIVVHDLIEKFGKESFIPTVRKIFKSSDKAVAWETKFLVKVNAQHNDAWLNRHNGKEKFIGPHNHSDESKSKIRSKITGIKRSEETRKKMSESAKLREEDRRASGWKYPADAQIKARKTLNSRIAAGEIDPYGPAFKEKIRKIKKGTKRRYMPDGSFIMIKLQIDQ